MQSFRNENARASGPLLHPAVDSASDSWFTGINSNVAGRQQRATLLYAGGATRYRRRCEELVAGGYAQFEFA